MSVVPVKICCISSLDEAQTAIDMGASILGLVGHMPSGPGIITDQLAAEIAAAVPATVETFLLTSETTAEGIIAHHQRVGSTALQMVDTLTEGSYADIRVALPGVKLVQVIHVLNADSVTQAKYAAEHVDALLLDSGNPNLATKELGGTGRVHDWCHSRAIVEAVEVPVYLAGGLNASNVTAALKQVQPHGLDLCSSVRTRNRLDPAKLAEFMQAVKAVC